MRATILFAATALLFGATPAAAQLPESEITGGVQAASEPLPALSARERAVARRYARGRSVKPAEVEIEIGEVLPQMQLHDFPDAAQRKAPALRAYRYFVIEDEVVLVDPDGSRIVDVIDEDDAR